MTKPKQVRHLTAKQVAARYGRSVHWVHHCKMLPKHKVGKYLYFIEAELEYFEKYRNENPDVKGRGFAIPTEQTVIRRETTAFERRVARKGLKFDVK